MSHRTLALLLALTALSVGGWKAYQAAGSGENMTAAANTFLGSLEDKQREQALLDFDTPKRVDWHFIPLDERKGVQVKHMTKEQREAAFKLLNASLSQIGYKKATTIMALESLLLELQKGRQGPLRDPERYYFTVFGKPTAEGKWGLSIEGHHLSLNFVVEKNRVIGSTPAVFCTNPATVMKDYPGLAEKGLRVLAAEEELAFQLVNALDDEQKKKAIIADTAPQEIRAAGEAQPPQEKPAGIAAAELKNEQKKLLRQLVEVYLKNHPEDVVARRFDEIEEAGWDNLHFCWAGALKPGVGHYYRIQGPTFLVELVNVQPDAAGNPANHVHSLWRDMRGDFGVAVKK